MRSSEITAFDAARDLDAQNGLLRVKNRRLFLPPAALRPLRRVLSLPEAANADFLRVDSGFLRKTFYAMAASAGLPPKLCAPRALRYARALELARVGVAPRVVSESLDISPLWLARVIRPAKASPNRFAARLIAFAVARERARLDFELAPGAIVTAVWPAQTVADLEPAIGDAIAIHIPPELVSLSRRPLFGLNCLPCEVASLEARDFETALVLRLGKKLKLLALAADGQKYAPGEKPFVFFPAGAIKLVAEENF